MNLDSISFLLILIHLVFSLGHLHLVYSFEHSVLIMCLNYECSISDTKQLQGMSDINQVYNIRHKGVGSFSFCPQFCDKLVQMLMFM